eukprot:scaffold977_cov253-Pinguiococcus_pyrenoidosus.AAC.20
MALFCGKSLAPPTQNPTCRFKGKPRGPCPRPGGSVWGARDPCLSPARTGSFCFCPTGLPSPSPLARASVGSSDCDASLPQRGGGSASGGAGAMSSAAAAEASCAAL